MKKHLLTSSCSGGGITRLRNNAFTLIELLAIIVILAIVAVITVPIILNIIENSRKGAATDSAYGYKDAVNKAYVQELAKPNNESLKLDGIYTVQNDGTLVPATGYTFGVTGYNSLPVSLSGDKPSSGELTYENNVLKSGWLVIGNYRVTFNQGGTVTTTKNTGSSSDVSNNNNENVQNNDGQTVADITTVDYGTYVDLGTSILDLENITLSDNSNPLADWRVFYKDTNGVWLMLADYLPIDSGTGADTISTIELVTGEDSGNSVWSDADDRQDLMTKLNGDWSNLIEGSTVVGKTGVQVKGAVDLPTWVASWNQSTADTLLYIDYIAEPDYELFWGIGYGISNSTPVESASVNVSSDTEYLNTLYFPHRTSVSNCYGYWLASLSVEEGDNLMSVGSQGEVFGNYTADDGYGIRPVIYLPNNISLDTTETVWIIAD